MPRKVEGRAASKRCEPVGMANYAAAGSRWEKPGWVGARQCCWQVADRCSEKRPQILGRDFVVLIDIEKPSAKRVERRDPSRQCATVHQREGKPCPWLSQAH